MKTNTWPSEWAVEHAIALKKLNLPEKESDVRLNSLTGNGSKWIESFVIHWLNHFVGNQCDFSRYGGIKGNSMTHYLIELVNFILYNQDLSNPQITLGIMYDFKKGL